MTNPRLSVQIERHAVDGRFTIARGSKTHVDVVVARVDDRSASGRGEGTPIYYMGDTAERAAAQLEAVAPAIAGGAARCDLPHLLPAGCARNALDAALWDLEAKQSGVRVWQRLGLPQPLPLLTAFTISLGEPGEMELAARAATHRELLKVKLGGDGDVDRVAAVRRAAPDARLIVDANEAWGSLDIEAMAHALLPYRVELIEQPVPQGEDALLDRVRSPIPLCADESLHDRATLDAVVGRYRLINIKLDKCGGLTEALALVHAARLRGLDIMTGCMLSTSLAIAPAFLVAMHGQYADLDGPLLLATDRTPAMQFSGSDVAPPPPELWG